jgi:hypothetical protein
MIIKLKEISILELTEGYEDHSESGVRAYGGQPSPARFSPKTQQIVKFLGQPKDFCTFENKQTQIFGYTI